MISNNVPKLKEVYEEFDHSKIIDNIEEIFKGRFAIKNLLFDKNFRFLTIMLILSTYCPVMK